MSGTAPAGAGPSGSPPRGRRRSVEVAGLAVAAFGVLVAILAWQLPRDPSPPAGAGGVSAPGSTPPSTPPGTPPSTTSTTPTTSTSAGQRYLTELTPASGGGFVQRIGGTHSLTMSCPTGESVDFKRSVTYDLPRAGYATLRLTALPTGERDTRVEVRLLVDDAVRGDQVITAGDSKPFQTGVAGSGTVELEITCDPKAKSVTFADPTLLR